MQRFVRCGAGPTSKQYSGRGKRRNLGIHRSAVVDLPATQQIEPTRVVHDPGRLRRGPGGGHRLSDRDAVAEILRADEQAHEQDAVATLESQDIPYTITNKSGSALTVCNVTEQRDKGFYTEVRPEWDSTDQEWDYVEYKIWRGLGLTVVCN